MIDAAKNTPPKFNDDLFGEHAAREAQRQLTEYPNVPGSAPRDTSEDAARKLTGKAAIHNSILDALAVAGPMTFYQMADYLKLDSRKVQPRMSELAKAGTIEDGGDRAPTPYGRMAIAWRMKE